MDEMEVLKKEIKDLEWDIKYHFDKSEIAKIKLTLTKEALQRRQNEPTS